MRTGGSTLALGVLARKSGAEAKQRRESSQVDVRSVTELQRLLVQWKTGIPMNLTLHLSQGRRDAYLIDKCLFI